MSDKKNKIVPLRSAGSSVPQAEYLASLIKLETLAKERTSSLLMTFFEQLDDSLFELADKSSNAGEQNLYFESMREARIQRRGIEKSVREAIKSGFRGLRGETLGADNIHDLSKSQLPKGLSVLERNQLEELVAVEGMIHKASSLCEQSLLELTARLDYIAFSPVATKQNPFSPEFICQCFVEASSGIDLSIKAKIIFYKIFEKRVLLELGPVIEHAGSILANDGILPQIQFQSAMREPVMASAEAISDPELLDLLDEHQKMALSLIAEVDASTEGDQWLKMNLNEPIDQVFVEFKANDVLSLSEQITLTARTGDIIKLVNNLVIAPIAGGDLPCRLVALVQSLEVAYLKLALIDKSLFSRESSHPARTLLNDIVSAMAYWQDQQTVDLSKGKKINLHFVEQLSVICECVLSEFDRDTDIFTQMMHDFKAFLEIEYRARVGLEQRLQQAEEAKLESEFAREQVNDYLGHILQQHAESGEDAPVSVKNLLLNAWSDVMVARLLEDGKDSPRWQQACDTASTLLKSICPKSQFQERHQLLQILPDLLKQLRLGLNEISFNPFDTNKLFAELEAEHLQRIKALGQSSGVKPLVSETVPTSDEESTEQYELPDYSPEQIQAILDQLQVGNWLDFVRGDGTFKGRLAAKIASMEKLIFVNRQGQKIAELSYGDFRRQIEVGQLKLIADEALFDRALESVIGGIRAK